MTHASRNSVSSVLIALTLLIAITTGGLVSLSSLRPQTVATMTHTVTSASFRTTSVIRFETSTVSIPVTETSTVTVTHDETRTVQSTSTSDIQSTSSTSDIQSTSSTSTTQSSSSSAGMNIARSQDLYWAGYQILTSAMNVSSVSSTWSVPALSSCIPENGSTYQYNQSVEWTGISSANAIEQIGTGSSCSQGSGTSAAYYFAWYELWPIQPNWQVIGIELSPGDIVRASVQYSSTNAYRLSLTDVTVGWTFAINGTQPNAEPRYADWMVEQPSYGSSPLADFTNVTFSRNSAVINGVNGSIASFAPSTSVHAINMIDHYSRIMASTSNLSGSGDFIVTWDSSS
ncbi:MAG: G1 family glutamic endopeptidase [Nitrososphaerales archaeon]